MGEAKRRKKLDPNYGKIPTPPDILVNSWNEGKSLAFIRCKDINRAKEELSSREELLSVERDFLGGDLIMYGGEDLFTFSLAREWVEMVLPRIHERYLEMGKGLVNIVPMEVTMATIGKSSRSPIEWNYWSNQELISARKNSLLLGSTNSLKPFLLWAVNNYDPSKEIVLLLCGFPISVERAANDSSLEELADNRFYGVVRHGIK